MKKEQRKKRIFLGTAILLSLLSVTAGATDKIHLKGQLIGMGTTRVPLAYNGAAASLGNSRDMVLHTDGEGRFDTVLTVKQPTYYRIFRNTLYLTPGDDLTLKITADQNEATFSGRGAEANTYLKGRLFPHAGSFINGGQLLKNSLETTRAAIDSAMQVRLQELEALQGVTPEFKDMERMRIKADWLNSYMYYPAYANMYAKSRGIPDLAVRDITVFYAGLTAEARPFVREMNDDRYLDVEVVRNVWAELISTPQHYAGWTEGLTFTPRARELVDAAQWLINIRQNNTAEEVANAKNFAASMKYQDFQAEVNRKIEQADRLIRKEAIDFEITGVDDTKHRLSDFRGKVIYIDFWATWCGPCLQQSPHFEALAAQFEGRDVVFLPVSTDVNRKAWSRYLSSHPKKLAQYNTTDAAVRESWAITHIPRFVIIDKDFRIVDAYAPSPSDPKAKAMLEELLK